MTHHVSRPLALSLALGLSLALSACVTANPDTVRYEDTQRLATVQDATVIAVRTVTMDGSQSGMGAVAGSMVGSIAGSNMGGYRDGFVGSIIGAVAGAVVGNAVERNATREAAVELTLQLRSGDKRMIIQGQGKEVFQPGDQVLVISNGYRARVTRAAPAGPAPVPATSSTSAAGERPAPVYTPH